MVKVRGCAGEGWVQPHLLVHYLSVYLSASSQLTVQNSMISTTECTILMDKIEKHPIPGHSSRGLQLLDRPSPTESPISCMTTLNTAFWDTCCSLAFCVLFKTLGHRILKTIDKLNKMSETDQRDRALAVPVYTANNDRHLTLTGHTARHLRVLCNIWSVVVRDILSLYRRRNAQVLSYWPHHQLPRYITSYARVTSRLLFVCVGSSRLCAICEVSVVFQNDKC